ncbi:hypothetical protein PG985_005594 [Apiospora marii]|uniref:uncharacterized protein n=1 Tax=Apiospora marii TaxID=335849 RepID=UPI00312D5DA2
MPDCDREDSPLTAALLENYNRRRVLKATYEEKKGSLAKKAEELQEQKNRIAQELRMVDTKYEALQAELAQLSAGYEADKTGLSHSCDLWAAARGLSSQPGRRTVTDNTPVNNRMKRDRQRYEEGPGAASGHVQKKKKTAAATEEPYTVDFDDVFQGGFALHKHMIIQYPPESDRWMPIRGLWPFRRWGSVYQIATKAQQNNTAVIQALDAGYKPLKPDSNKKPTPSQIISQPQSAPREQEVIGDASRLSTEVEWSEENDGEIITHPLEGKAYLGY